MRVVRAVMCAVALVITSMTFVGSPAEAKAGAATSTAAVYHDPQVFWVGQVRARRRHGDRPGRLSLLGWQ